MTIGTTTQERGYYVLNQLTNMVNGKGWRCSKKEHVVETFKNFVFATSEIEYETYIHLSREDCQRMVETKITVFIIFFKGLDSLSCTCRLLDFV